jgi:hypothetical protein
MADYIVSRRVCHSVICINLYDPQRVLIRLAPTPLVGLIQLCSDVLHERARIERLAFE